MRDVAASLPQPGDTIAGKYVLERVIGEGGMSVVYGATHRVTGKRFAIKWLLPDDSASSGDTAKRFIREAQVAGLFEHPNVVEVYDVGEVAGSFYMVMEWLEGESLAERLRRVGKLSFEDVCTYLIPCMHGVVEAHAAGIVHRDLKPANIFLCRAMHHTPERPKVLDFGIAKLSKHVFDVNSLVTKSGVLIGTPHYLSPEQLRSLPVDHRTDVYAFGVIMYQLLTGQLPFPAENFGQLVLQIATGTPAPLRELAPDLPEGVETIVGRAMAREPNDRFQDVQQLIEALERLAPQFASPFSSGPSRSHPPRTPRPSARTTPPPAPHDVTPAAMPAPESVPLAEPQPLVAKTSRRVLTVVTLAAASALIFGGIALLLRLWGQPPSAAEDRAPGEPNEPVRSSSATTATTPAPVPADTTRSAATAPVEAALPPRAAPAASAAPAATQVDMPGGTPGLEPTGTPRPKRPAKPTAPQPIATPEPTPVVEPTPPPPTPTPPPSSERNPLDMRLQ